MPNFFLAGRELIQWDLEVLEANGPYRLTVRHGQGSIVEYFKDTEAALLRERELEHLLIAARGAGSPSAISMTHAMSHQ